jgi:hypothetical protein
MPVELNSAQPSASAIAWQHPNFSSSRVIGQLHPFLLQYSDTLPIFLTRGDSIAAKRRRIFALITLSLLFPSFLYPPYPYSVSLLSIPFLPLKAVNLTESRMIIFNASLQSECPTVITLNLHHA